MALRSSIARKTRSSTLSPQVSTPEHIIRNRRLANTEGKRYGAKRRVVYPDENPSPSKRSRHSMGSSKNENSPKDVKAKSFYGKSRASYLNPLDRKKIEDIKQKNQHYKEGVFSPEDKKMKKRQKTPDKPFGKAPTKKKAKSNGHQRLKSPLQELDPLLNYSPVKNKKKLETRVYSPSRKNQKFFKSRRSNTPSSSKPVACVQNKRLHVTYKPTGIKHKESSPSQPPFMGNAKFVSTSFSKPVIKDSPLSQKTNVRLPVPLKKETPLRVRTVINSSKNPNSPDLFSPSDWDFGDDDEMECPNSTSSLDGSQASSMIVNCSEDSRLAEDDLSVCSNQTSNSSRTVADAEQDDEESTEDRSSSNTETTPCDSPRVFDIFNMKKAKTLSETSSNRSSPSDKKQGFNLRGTRSGTRLRSLTNKDGREQMTLDFGQTLKGAIQCPSCGMTYNEGEPTDESTHKKFHDKVLAVLKFQGWKKETVLQEFADGCRIIVVMPDEKLPMKKVMAVKKIVDEDLGFVVDSSGISSNAKVFLFISEAKQIVGFCVAETISKAYQALTEDERSSQSEGTGTKPWCCSTKPEKVRCGINRIWVLRGVRHKKVATKLIDCVRAHFLLGFPMRKMDVAFTDPTPDGRAFATKYIGTPSFLVYKH